MVSRWFTPAYQAAHPEVPEAFVAGLAAAADEGYAGCCEAIAAMDLRPVLGSITAPTLVIAGARGPGHAALARGRDRLGHPRRPAASGARAPPTWPT